MNCTTIKILDIKRCQKSQKTWFRIDLERSRGSISLSKLDLFLFSRGCFD